MCDKEKIILKLAVNRKIENPNDIAVQRTFFQYAMKVIPILESVKKMSVGIELYDSVTVKVTDDLFGELLDMIDRFLAWTNFVNIENSWKFFDVDTLLDGLKALNFYACASTRQHIRLAAYKILHYLQTRNDDIEAKIATACSEMMDILYLAPFRYDEDSESYVKYKLIHVSERASEKMMKHQNGKSIDDYIFNKSPFCGCADYSFAPAKTGEENMLGKTMHLQSVVKHGHSFLPLFTDMEALHTIFGEKACVGMFTWDDFVERINESLKNSDGSFSEIAGIVFNPGLTNVMLSVEEVQIICEKFGKYI